MRAHRRLARALVATLLALAPAAVARPAAADLPPNGLLIQGVPGCPWLRRGEPTRFQARAVNFSDSDAAVSVTPVLPPGFTAEVSPASATVYAYNGRYFDVTVTPPPDAALGATTLRLDAAGGGLAGTYELTLPVVDVPAAPTAVTATPGDGSALVTWTPGPDRAAGIPDVDQPRTRTYVVTSSPGGARTEVVDATSATVAGLANGTAYTFTVTEESPLGAGQASAPSTPVVPAAAPDEPVADGSPPRFAGTVTTEAVNGMVAVSIRDTASDATGWLVTTQPDGWETLAPRVTLDDGTFAGDGLLGVSRPGTATTVTVRTVNDAGAGLPGDPTAPVTPSVPPEPPTLFSSLPGDGELEVCFLGAWAGGSPVTSHVIGLDDGAERRTVELAPGARSATLTGLVNGTGYALHLVATTQAFPEPDFGSARYFGTAFSAGPPPAPATAQAEPGDGYALVSWSYVNGAHNFEVVAEPGGATMTVSQPSAWVSGLANGTAYTFTVRAIDDWGLGAPITTAPVTPAGPPLAPANVTAVADPADPSHALVSWSPADPNGSPVTAYRVRWNGGGSASETAGDATSASVPSGYGWHEFTVEAVNARGAGDPSATVGVSLEPPAAPGQVTGVSAVPDPADPRAVLVSWSPAAPNRSPITGYVVRSGAVAVPAAGAATSASVPAPYGEPRTFTVEAVNAIGTGEPSEPAGPVTLVAPVVTVTPPPAITLSGTAGLAFAGAGAHDVRYRVARWDGGFGAYQSPAAWQGTAATSVSLAATPGRTYCFGVRASGADAWSADHCTTAPLDDRSLTAGAGWTRGTSGAYYGGTFSLSRTAGATLTRTGVQARRLAVVATRCPTCGTVGVYVNGALVRKVSLAASTTAYRQVVAVDLGSLRSGTVTLRALNAGRVYVDGLGVSRV